MISELLFWKELQVQNFAFDLFEELTLQELEIWKIIITMDF